MSRPRVLILNRDDTSTTKTWSGIPFHIKKILEDKGVEITVIDNLGYPNDFISKVKNRIKRTLGLRPYYYSDASAKFYAKKINPLIKNKARDFDCLFSIDFHLPLPYLDVECPILHFSDASLAMLIDIQYPGFTEVKGGEKNVLMGIEERGFQRADRVLITSDFAIERIKKIYPGVDSSKFKRLPFSSQIYPAPKKTDLQLRTMKSDEVIRFLFVGRDWKRKGGEKTVEIMKSLKNLGMKVHLSIVGANPEVNLDSDEFTIYENLDIKIEKEKEVYFSLLMNSHFFILPTLNEAFGIAYVEAFSFGLPVISHRVCAMEEIVDHQKTGLLFDVELSSGDVAEQIKECIALGDENYLSMQETARSVFEERFSAENWVDQFLRNLEETKTIYETK